MSQTLLAAYMVLIASVAIGLLWLNRQLKKMYRQGYAEYAVFYGQVCRLRDGRWVMDGPDYGDPGG